MIRLAFIVAILSAAVQAFPQDPHHGDDAPLLACKAICSDSLLQCMRDLKTHDIDDATVKMCYSKWNDCMYGCIGK